MGAQGLSSRAIIGEFYNTLSQGPTPWVESVSMRFDSDQESETYKWLGQSPAMREFISGRQAKGFRENGITIENKEYEATLEILERQLRRDKTGQIMVRARELAQRANSHWASLLSTLIVNGASTVCYDGQYFFDTDHDEGDSGSQSNDLSFDISGIPVAVHGSVAQPSIQEMQYCILQAIQAILGFKDDQGEPMNEDAMEFLVMVPNAYWQVARAAVAVPVLGGGETGLIANMPDLKIDVAVNPRLTFTDAFAVFRTDGQTKPLIRQEEVPLEGSAIIDVNSETFFMHRKHYFGVYTSRNVGYGYWQQACRVQMT